MKHADGEEEFIAGLINLTGGDKSLLGDDCALLKNYTPPLLIAADCLTKNIHYDNSFTPAQIAEKLVGVNVSDFAAMGGRPQNAILTLCSSRGIEFQEELSTNIIKYLNKKNVTLVGGDISAAPKNHETVTLTMLGAIKKETLMWRHLGQPEDLLAISGPLGGAATVLSTGSSKREILHQIPDNLSLGENLAELGVRCAIDISDGLLKDLQRILRASKTGALIDYRKIPIHPLARELTGDTALQQALSGGEDYQLLFSFSPCLKPDIKELGAHIIGELTAETGKISFAPPLPEEINIDKYGFDHFK